MSNTNRPDPDCDHAGYDGCTGCGCSECGALVDPETLGQLTLPSGKVVQACAGCRSVPEAVEDEAKTVETRTLTDAELLDLLDSQAVA